MCSQVVNSAQRFGVTAIHPGIGPFVGQGAVACSALFDLPEGFGERGGSIARSVVSQYFSNLDAKQFETGVGSLSGIGGSLLALVAQQLALRQPGVTVDRGVHAMIAPDRIAVPADDSAALVSVGVTPTDGTAQPPPAVAG
jgi:hypothetical protein